MGDWGAVGAAIRDRMRELNMSTAHLARETGLSETTIRSLRGSSGKHDRSALVAVSGVLCWRHDHLLNILHSEPHKNVLVKPPLEYRLREIMHSEIAALKEEITALTGTLRAIDNKIDMMQESRELPTFPADVTRVRPPFVRPCVRPHTRRREGRGRTNGSRARQPPDRARRRTARRATKSARRTRTQ